jgi:hypothetical protein
MAEYPDRFDVLLPEPYLTAIGKVCAQWSVLEWQVGMVISKLSGYEIFDARPAMLTAHMSWPQKLDVLGALVAANRESYPHLERFDVVRPMLKKAAAGRNRVVHGQWTSEEGKIHMLRLSARGELKTEIVPVTVKEIEIIADDISAATAAVLKMILNK